MVKVDFERPQQPRVGISNEIIIIVKIMLEKNEHDRTVSNVTYDIVCKIHVNDKKRASVIRKDGNRDSEAKTHEKCFEPGDNRNRPQQ